MSDEAEVTYIELGVGETAHDAVDLVRRKFPSMLERFVLWLPHLEGWRFAMCGACPFFQYKRNRRWRTGIMPQGVPS